MPRHHNPVVDTILTIDKFPTAYQLNTEDASLEFDAVYKQISGTLGQLSEDHWRVSFTLNSESLE